jgi:hypothetical protein
MILRGEERSMSQIAFDEFLRSKLNGLDEHVELCDECGRIVGHFLPDQVYKRLVYHWVNAQVTDEELDAASTEPGGRSLEEIWKSLGQMP